MITKSFLISIILLFATSTIYSQIAVGIDLRDKSKKTISKDAFNQLKNKKTVFVVDDHNIESYTKMINEVWNFNSYIILSRKAFDKSTYKNEKYAIFELKGFLQKKTYNDGSVYNKPFVFYSYYHFVKKGKKFKSKSIAAAFLEPTKEGADNFIEELSFSNLDRNFINYGLGYLKNYLQLIQRKLKNQERFSAYDAYVNKKEIKKLKNYVLYAPKKFNIKNESDRVNEMNEIKASDYEKVLQTYAYDYQIIEPDELNSKILNAKESIYYLQYLTINAKKFINIINAKTGVIIYKEYNTFSGRFKEKNIERINKFIK